MLILLAILIFGFNFEATFMQLQHEDVSVVTQLLYPAFFVFGVGSWLHPELRKQKMVPLYCPGLLLQTGWWILVPYYLYKTRKAKALIPIGILIGSFVLSQVAAIVVYAVTQTVY